MPHSYWLRFVLRRAPVAGLTSLILAAAPCAALASTATTNFSVTATVLAVCNVQATNLAFGSYSATNATPDDASSSVSVTCSNGQPYAIALDAGAGTGATVAARTMASGANALSYALYTGSARTTIWGDGSLSTSTVAGSGSGALQAYTVYGRVRANQYVAAGRYTDTVTVTITY